MIERGQTYTDGRCYYSIDDIRGGRVYYNIEGLKFDVSIETFEGLLNGGNSKAPFRLKFVPRDEVRLRDR